MKGAWLRFFRIVNLPTVPGDVLAGAAAVFAFSPSVAVGAKPVAAACAAACGLYLFGLSDNDIVGAGTDGPERPIPSGEISLGAARLARGLCLLAVLAAGLWGGLPRLWWIGAFALFCLTVTYNRCKVCLAMGLCRSISVVCGGAVAAGALAAAGVRPTRQSALVLLALALLWTAYIAFVTRYSADEAADPAKRRAVGLLIGALVYLQLGALLVAFQCQPTPVTRNLLLCGAAALVALRLLRRILPGVSAS